MQNRLALTFILVTVLLDSIGIGLIFPVMPDLIEDVTGGSLSQAALWGGILTAAFALMQFLFGPIMGNLSDRYGRRPILLASLAIMALDYLVMAVAGTLWLLFAGRLVAGISAATHSTATAFMADISPPDQRAKNFGFIGAAFGVGFVAGPLLGGLLAEIDTRAPFWAAAILAAANLVLGWFVLPETVTDENRRAFSWARANPLSSFKAIGHLPGLGRYLALHFVYTVAFYVYPTVWSYYGIARFGWDPFMIGFSLALFGLALAAVQATAVAPSIRRWGERRTAIYGAWIDVVAFAVYGFVTSGFWALVFTPVAALSGVVGPALQGLMTNATPNDQQGELQGVLTSLTAVAMGISPVIMTGIFSFFTAPGAPVYSPGAPFLLSALLMFVCIAILSVKPRRPQPA